MPACIFREGTHDQYSLRMRLRRTAIALAAVLVLVGCTPSPEVVVDDSAPSATPSESPEPEESSAAPVEPEGLTQSDYDNIAAAVSSGNTAALEGYLARSVNFIIAASECCGPLTPLEAIGELEYLNFATGPWTYPVSAASIAEYRTHFYGQYFPDGSFVMASSDDDPFVISFQFTGEKISGIFISAGESFLYH
jgi:hypothetical protein